MQLAACAFVAALAFSSAATATVTVAERQKAARSGDVEAAYDLGKMYEFGLAGAPQDDVRSLQWYRQAADKGHRAAQFQMSVAYYLGNGVAKDRAEAAKWWTLAMRDGGRYAEIIRPTVESAQAKLTADEMSEGQRRAAAWQLKP